MGLAKVTTDSTAADRYVAAGGATVADNTVVEKTGATFADNTVVKKTGATGSSSNASAVSIHPDVYERPVSKSETALVPKAEAREQKPILLFNDECGVCRKLAAWVLEQEKRIPGGVNLVEKPIGDDPDAVKTLNPNLNIWDAYAAVHVLMPDGSMKVGGEAVAEVLKRLPATRWFAWLFDVNVLGARPFQSMLNGAYYVLDRVRPAFGCESCMEGPPAWAKPIEWAVKAYRAIFRRNSSAPPFDKQ